MNLDKNRQFAVGSAKHLKNIGSYLKLCDSTSWTRKWASLEANKRKVSFRNQCLDSHKHTSKLYTVSVCVVRKLEQKSLLDCKNSPVLNDAYIKWDHFAFSLNTICFHCLIYAQSFRTLGNVSHRKLWILDKRQMVLSTKFVAHGYIQKERNKFEHQYVYGGHHVQTN